jgi:hypothetical protein
MTRRWVVVVLLLVGAVTAPAASAAGDLVIPPVYSGVPPGITSIVASEQLAAYVVQRGSDLSRTTVVVRRSDGLRTVVAGTQPAGTPGTAAGPYLLLQPNTGNRFVYDVRDGSRRQLVSAGSRSEQVALRADGGWAEVIADSGGTLRDVVVHAADGGTQRRLTTGISDALLDGVDANGVLWMSRAGVATYVDLGTGDRTTVASNSTCSVVMTSNAFGRCDGSRLYRIDRTDLHVVQSWPIDGHAGPMLLTPDATAWVAEPTLGDYRAVTSPVTAGAATSSTSVRSGWAGWSGAELVVAAGDHASDRGIYPIAADHAGVGGAVDLAGGSAPPAVSASTGRVITSRLTGVAGDSLGDLRETTLATGTTRTVSSDVVVRGFALSGGLTGGVEYTPRGNDIVVTDGVHEVGRRTLNSGTIQALSGHRAVVYNLAAGTSRVVDLRWRNAADVTVPGLASLSGSMLVRLAADGSVRVRDLDSGGDETVVRDGGSVPSTADLTQSAVATDGTWVLWSLRDSAHVGIETVAERLDGFGRVTLPAGVQSVGLAGGRLAWSAADGAVHVEDLATAQDTVVGQRASRDLQANADVALAADCVAWTADNGSTIVHPLSVLPGSPRLLGGFVPARFTRNPGLVIDLAVDRPMSAVQLVVTDSVGVVVARVSSSAPMGDVRAVWDGRLVDGSVAPDGTYSWQLTAAGSDGPLMATTSTPLSGSAVLDTRVPALTVSLPVAVSDASTTPRARLTWGTDDPTARFAVRYIMRVPGISGLEWTRPIRALEDQPAGTVVFGVPPAGIFGNLIPEAAQRFTVTVRDEAGNARVFTRDVLTPYDDRLAGIRYSSGWSRGGGGAYWLGTVTSTTVAGAQALLPARTNRVVVIGTRCPTCGRLRLVIDGRLVRVVDTYSASAAVRQRLVDVPLPGAPAVHSIKIVVEGTAHRPLVRLDGIALVR